MNTNFSNYTILYLLFKNYLLFQRGLTLDADLAEIKFHYQERKTIIQKQTQVKICVIKALGFSLQLFDIRSEK